METVTQSFIKVRVNLFYCLKPYKYWHSQKRAYRLSTHLHDQVYIDRRVQFHPSLHSSYTRSDNSGQ